jgi:hypothetical protein
MLVGLTNQCNLLSGLGSVLNAIISPDAVLHGSAFDFVDAVCGRAPPSWCSRASSCQHDLLCTQRHEVPESLDADASWRSAQEQSISDNDGLPTSVCNARLSC